MDRRGRTAAVCGRAVVLAAAALLTGCTMCPDPYDYTGPVPNGSTPQNDFRARSRGIIPLGSAPRPWPSIVKQGGVKGGDVVQVAGQRPDAGPRRPAEARSEPTLAETDGDTGGQPDGTATIEPTSVLVIAEEDEPAAPEPTAAPLTVADPPTMVEVAPPLAAVDQAGAASPPAVDVPPQIVETPPLVVETPPPAIEVPPPTIEVPRLAETPGWRSRQAR